MPRGVPNRKAAPAADTDPAAVLGEQAASDPNLVESETVQPDAASEPDVDTAPPAADTPAEDPNPLCPVHFPDGWPRGVTSAGCVDGQWERPTTAGD